MIEITLVRHGQSVANVTGHWQGQGDSPLSERGQEQAAALADRLAEQHFDRVVSSDLSRAADTAAAVAKRWNRDVDLQQQWREIDVGDWEGLSRAEVKERFADQLADLAAGKEVRVGGAESWPMLAKRGAKALHELRAQLEEGQRAIVFAHGGIISSLLTLLLGIQLKKPRPIGNVNNTGVSTIRFEGDSPSLVVYNDTTHLSPFGAWGETRREEGAAVIGLMPSASEGHPFEAVYSHGQPGRGSMLEHPTLDAAITFLAESHPKGRVALEAEPSALSSFAHSILGCKVSASPAKVTHLVASPRGCTLADFNVG